jgi:hypothetical protein
VSHPAIPLGVSKEIIMAHKATFSPVVNPSFGNAILKSFEGEAKAIEKARAVQDSAIQKMMDAFVIACDKPKPEFMKGNAATNAARFQVKQVFDALAEKNFISKSTAASYQSAFWIAFEQGIPFQRDLNNKKETPDNTGAGADKPTSGKVETTDIPALHKTLSKALAQARLLNQQLFAADLVDLITDTWPDFKETVLSK